MRGFKSTGRIRVPSRSPTLGLRSQRVSTTSSKPPSTPLNREKVMGIMKAAAGRRSKPATEVAEPGLKKGGPVKYEKGGMTLAKHASMPASKAHAGMKKGGAVSKADGTAMKGKTKGKMVSMKKGSSCK